MQCLSPLFGYLNPYRKQDGSLSWKFGTKPQEGYLRSVSIPCGKCMACRKNHARDWALRCMLEAMDYDFSTFFTLTYAEPAPPSLQKRHANRFCRRFREQMGHSPRYLIAGEYGPRTHRPHYHGILFGVRPDQLDFERLWPLGYSMASAVNSSRIVYTCQYAMKKQGVESNFFLMSRRPGIGRRFIEKYAKWILENERDALHVDGVPYRLPRYFLDFLSREYSGDYDAFRARRIKKGVYITEKIEVLSPCHLQALYSRLRTNLEQINSLKFL